MHNFLIYGGTFDPIHKGHLQTAINVQDYFNFEQIKFLPCKIPVLKNQAQANPAQRVEMLKLGLAPYAKSKKFELDLTEINRDSPSYMVDSLRHFRSTYGSQLAITLLIGVDAFNQLHLWHEWEELISLSNILIINRAGFKYSPSDKIKTLVERHKILDSKKLRQKPNGQIYYYDAGSYSFSSSWIREQLAKNQPNMEDYLPNSVLKYIKINKIYSII